MTITVNSMVILLVCAWLGDLFRDLHAVSNPKVIYKSTRASWISVLFVEGAKIILLFSVIGDNHVFAFLLLVTFYVIQYGIIIAYSKSTGYLEVIQKEQLAKKAESEVKNNALFWGLREWAEQLQKDQNTKQHTVDQYPE